MIDGRIGGAVSCNHGRREQPRTVGMGELTWGEFGVCGFGFLLSDDGFIFSRRSATSGTKVLEEASRFCLYQGTMDTGTLETTTKLATPLLCIPR